MNFRTTPIKGQLFGGISEDRDESFWSMTYVIDQSSHPFFDGCPGKQIYGDGNNPILNGGHHQRHDGKGRQISPSQLTFTLLDHLNS